MHFKISFKSYYNFNDKINDVIFASKLSHQSITASNALLGFYSMPLARNLCVTMCVHVCVGVCVWASLAVCIYTQYIRDFYIQRLKKPKIHDG